jgi:FkbH-like protein
MKTSTLGWRPPLASNWAERFAKVEAEIAERNICDYAELKSLSNQQLSMREQLRVERLAKKLNKSGAPHADFQTVSVGLLGHGTLSYLPAPLAAAGLARGLLISSEEAPYNSVASFAFSPTNCFEKSLDAILIVLDESAFSGKRPILDVSAETSALNEAEALVVALAESAKSKTGCPAIFATLPSTHQIGASDMATVGSSTRFRHRMNMILADGAMEGKWLLWDQAALANRVGLEHWFDPKMYHAAKIPFSVEVCPLAADNIASQLAALKGKAARALVLDLDNTLWGGVIGDDGLAGLGLGQNSAVGEAFVAFQDFILGLRERGVVLAVCSKNNDDIAREPFQDHPEMVLKEEHIAVFQANWNDKATNIRSIAETLSLGLESIAFVDDNPAERERVRQELPLVSTIEVGSDPSLYIERVMQSGVFDHLPLTTEDTARAASYGGRAAAAQVRAKVGNYEEYLTSLEMEMSINTFDDVGRPRIAQLINKSNQFNLTTRRYSEEDVRKLQNDPDLFGWQVTLKDKFAAHGMIAVVIVRKNTPDWIIDTWLQSCRVLERGVEQTIMNSLLQEAERLGVERIKATYIPTDRNTMVADFFEKFGFQVDKEHANGTIDYVCFVADYQLMATFIDCSQANLTG